jgi:DNA-binding MarR family transcriptional regulator
MVAKRKVQKGLATKVLCLLRHEGRAPSEHVARSFGYSVSAVDRVLRKLEDRGLVTTSFMSPGSYFVTNKGYSAVSRAKCPTFRS